MSLMQTHFKVKNPPPQQDFSSGLCATVGGNTGNPSASPREHSPISSPPDRSPQVPMFTDCQGALFCEPRPLPSP